MLLEVRTAISIQGFRKIDTDRWEFANDSFVREKRHLLKNIHRRRSTVLTQQLSGSGYGGGGSASGESANSGLGTEVEKLKKEKSVLMKEVVELQQQHRGTADRVENVEQKLQASEKRQKQMVSFFAKIFQIPTFVDRLRQMKAHRELGSPRTRRKLVKQKQQEGGSSYGSMEGQIVKFSPELPDFMASEIPVLDSTDYLLQDVVGKMSGEMELSLKDLASRQQFTNSPERVAAGTSRPQPFDPLLREKVILSPEMDVTSSDYLSRGLMEFPSPAPENLVSREEMLNIGFEATDGMSVSGTDLWGSISNYDMPEMGPYGSGGLSDIWDLGSLPVAGS